jgi:threonine/homoserine/homoserine lactone efflux protein
MLVLTRGLGQGRTIAVCTALGAVGAGIVQLPLLALGVASIFASSQLAVDILRYGGAAYLIYLGVRLFSQRAECAEMLFEQRQASMVTAIREGMIFQPD